LEYGLEHRKAVCTGREHRNAYGTWDRNRKERKNWNWTKLEMVILRVVLVIPKFGAD